MKTKTAQPENVIWLDNGIGITEPDGKLVRRDGNKVTRVGQGGCSLSQPPSGSVIEITAYGKLERWQTPGRNIICKMVFSDGSPDKWVPLTGKKTTKPKSETAAKSHEKGEALFDPSQFIVGTGRLP